MEGRGDQGVAGDGEAEQGAPEGEDGDVEEHEDELLRRALALLQGRAWCLWVSLWGGLVSLIVSEIPSHPHGFMDSAAS
jgi:hypothetical protein